MTALDRIGSTLHPAPVRKGDVFWYRLKGRVYGGIVLDITPEYYFIALSEECSSIPRPRRIFWRCPFIPPHGFPALTCCPVGKSTKLEPWTFPAAFKGAQGLLFPRRERTSKTAVSETPGGTPFKAIGFPTGA